MRDGKSTLVEFAVYTGFGQMPFSCVRLAKLGWTASAGEERVETPANGGPEIELGWW